MSTTPDASSARASTTPTHRVGFVGDAGVGKTTVAALVADRLAERTDVTVSGEAARIANTSDSGDSGLGIAWTVVDCASGVDALDARADQLDTVFIVATPDTLDSVHSYADRARHYGVDCFVVVNRFQESARDDLRAFEGPDLAEYIYDEPAVSAAIDDGRVPSLPEWTLEAILIEALQPERQPAETAVAALESGDRAVVNVEVDDQAAADAVIAAFETAGFPTAYFGCNCRCHDGHVLARRP